MRSDTFSRRGNSLRGCDAPHTGAQRPVISHPAIEWFTHVGEVAVTSRKPAFLRWAEEAEAKQVFLWAGLESDAPREEARSDPYPAPPADSRRSALLLRRLRSLLRRANVNCTRR
jgi:hypothetical protein